MEPNNIQAEEKKTFYNKPTIWTNLSKLRLENVVKKGEVEDTQSFSISFRQGYPRLHVTYTESKAVDFKDKTSNIPLDIIMLTHIANRMIEASNDKNYSVKIDMKNLEWVDDKMTDNVVVVGSILIGRDVEGFLTLTIRMNGKPDLVFRVLPSSKWFNKEENKIDTIFAVETSEKYSRSFADLLKITVGAYAAIYSEKYETTVK